KLKLSGYGRARRLHYRNARLNIFVKAVAFDIAYLVGPMSSANSQFRGAKLCARAPVSLLEFNSKLVFAGPAVIVSDDAHAMLFDKLLDRPSGYRCSRLVDHWTPRPFSATATDVVSLARSSFHAYKAHHCILVL
ncbi:hypothetical protein TSMEX_001211, partial [Taenia solium]